MTSYSQELLLFEEKIDRMPPKELDYYVQYCREIKKRLLSSKRKECEDFIRGFEGWKKLLLSENTIKKTIDQLDSRALTSPGQRYRFQFYIRGLLEELSLILEFIQSVLNYKEQGSKSSIRLFADSNVINLF